MTTIGDIRKAHQVGRHLLAHSYSGGSWCRRCSTWACYLKDMPCDPYPKAKRWWPQGWVGGPRDGREDDTHTCSCGGNCGNDSDECLGVRGVQMAAIHPLTQMGIYKGLGPDNPFATLIP